MITTVINGDIHALCERCYKFSPATQQMGEFFDNGIDFIIGGGYGLFYDPFHKDEEVTVKLCHDCSVEVLKFIGVYDDPKFNNGHSTERDEKPCCDHSWTPITDGNDEWVGTKLCDGTIRYHK